MWTTAELISRTDWNDQLFSLRFKADIAPFIPGQFIKLSIREDEKRIARAYSVVSSPKEGFVEILAVTVPEGKLTPYLHGMLPGQQIEITDKASGFMTLDEIPRAQAQGKHLWFLATGTAVGPFLSMLDTAEPWERFEKIVLVYGVRKVIDLAYLTKITDYQNRYPEQFVFVPMVTRESYQDALSCRIPDGLITGDIEAKAGLKITAKDSQVMICGNPGMITDAQVRLIDMGLAKNLRRKPGQITVEKYW